MDRFDQKDLDEKILILNDFGDEESLKSWKEGLGIKLIIILPILSVVIGLFVVNGTTSIVTIMSYSLLAIVCIFLGVLIYLLIEK